MVISLVLTVGWVLSRRPSDARLEPRVLLSATPPPVPLEQERTYIFLEGDEAGDDIQVAAEPEGSWESVISADGRWVAFSSSVKNLVPGDKNGMVDIFVFDLERETIERVNISNSGMEANRNSYQPAISADGRFVVYTSAATNLDPRDHQLCGEGVAFYNCFDIFLRDRRTNETRMISVTSDGEPVNNISVGPAISADGRWVAYWSMADNLVSNDAEVCGEGEQVYNCADIFLHDLSVGTTERIGIGRTVGETEVPFTPLQFSADGGTLLTTVRSSDLIAPSLGMENNQDIYLFDREAGSWAQVNVSSDEEVGNAPSQAASISGDGRYVAFASAATNLIPSDERGHIDVFLRNLENRYTERISEVRTGEETDGDSGALEVGVHQDWYFEALEISQDARWLLFVSKASNLSRDVVFDCSGNPSLPGESYLFCYHLYLHDRLTRVTRHIYGPFFNYPPYASISADGSRVIFLAETNDCHSRGLCTDIFIYDRLDRSLRALSVATADASPFIPSTAENPQWAFVNIFRGHRGWINDLRFTHDGSQLVSAALDNSVRMWTVPRGESALVLRNLENSIFVATSSLDGNSLVTGAMDGDVLIWQLPGGRLKGVIEGRAGAVAAVEYSPDGKNLAIGTPRGVTLYNTDTVDKVEELKYPRGTVTSVAFSTDGRFLAVGNSDHSVWVHRVEDGEVVLRLGSHTRDVTSVAFSPDGKYLASGSADRTVNVWALSGENGGSLSAALYKTFSHFDWVSAVVFSPDGKTLISGSYDGAVRIWTLLEGAVGNELLFRRPQDQIRSLSITWDGAYLAAGTSRGEIYLWRALAEE